MMQIVAATNNPDKLREIREILGDKFNILSLKDEGIFVDIEETSDSFYENALFKAKTISSLTGKIALADDSGLIVKALGGAPGVYSARYAGVDGDSCLNRIKLLSEMKDVSDRRASFYSTVVVFFPDGTTLCSEGNTAGLILLDEIGDGGFGYDSIFYSLELKKSFGQTSPSEKNIVSHRGVALRKMVDLLQKKIEVKG